LERCVPLVPQRHTPLSRALNLPKNSVCIMCLMIDSNIMISKLWGVCRTQSCDPPRNPKLFQPSRPCGPSLFFCFLSAPTQVAFGPPGHSGPAHLRESSSCSARAAATHSVGVAAPSSAHREPNRRAARPPSFFPTNRRHTVSPSSSKRPISKRTPRPRSRSSYRLPPLLSSPIKGPYASATLHRVQSRSNLHLSPSRASCRREQIPVSGLPPAPHRPPSPTVGTPEASSSFSPTAGELPLTGAASSPRSGEPFGRRRPWSTMDP
jgi:hypothetical protein